MRTLLLVSTFLALSLPLRAQGQLVNVTPQTLEGWTLSGADMNALGSKTQLVLPPGAQLSREFRDGAIVLRLLMRPVFSEQSENWPILGLGGAALALVRENGRERMVLVTDETKGIDLPWTIPAGENGKAAALEIFLACAPASGVGLVGFGDQMQPFELKPSTKSVDVWLNAGQVSPWPVDLMQVLLVDSESGGSGSANQHAADSTEPKLAPGKLQEVLKQLHVNDRARGATVTTPGRTGVTQKMSAVSTLEIFTPPALRRVQRSEAVRNTVAKTRAN